MPATDTLNDARPRQDGGAQATQASVLVDDLRAIRRRAEGLMARVTGDDVFARPSRGGHGWSVGQCLDHLTLTNRQYLAAIRDALAGAPRAASPVTAPIRSTAIGRWFIAKMEPGTAKMPTLGTLRPRSALTRAQVWPEFLRGLDEIEAVLRDAAAIDLNRPTFASPFFTLSRVRVGTGFRIMLAHLRRHLHQAEQVLEQRN